MAEYQLLYIINLRKPDTDFKISPFNSSEKIFLFQANFATGSNLTAEKKFHCNLKRPLLISILLFSNVKFSIHVSLF